MTRRAITGDSMMREVLEAYPSAQRALFGRYHIGGCNSCGYEAGDTLEAVARSHNIVDVAEVVAFLEDAEQLDRRIQVSAVDVDVDVAAALGSEDPPRLIDVQVDPSVPRYELASDTLGGATLRPLRSAVSQVEGCQSAVAS